MTVITETPPEINISSRPTPRSSTMTFQFAALVTLVIYCDIGPPFPLSEDDDDAVVMYVDDVLDDDVEVVLDELDPEEPGAWPPPPPPPLSKLSVVEDDVDERSVFVTGTDVRLPTIPPRSIASIPIAEIGRASCRERV